MIAALRPQLLFSFILLGVVAGAVWSCEGAEKGPPRAAPEGMVWIEGDDQQAGFFMDATETTIADFAKFITATDYVTEAEDFGWSGVFSKDSLTWLPVDSATWLFPLGPASRQSTGLAGSQPATRELVPHSVGTSAPAATPVTQVSLRDVNAYLSWAGKQLPTEPEWTFAAAQSGTTTDFPWGEEMTPDGKYLGNWWQGPFPYEDNVLDDFPGVAPVKSFPPAANGLYDMSGNVWEWTATTDARTGQNIIKGGSFLCSTSYCTGFNLTQQQLTPADSGLNHLGFRGIIRAK